MSQPSPSQAPSPALPRCRECGAELTSDQTKCWLCGKPQSATNPYASPAAAADLQGGAGQFSLATILLVITLVAICLGTFRLSPGMGIWVVIVATPALVRTFIAGIRQKSAGHRLTLGEKILAFIASAGIIILIGVAAVVAFEIACWGSCALVAAAAGEGEPAMMTGIVLGGIAALVTTIALLWVTRPRKA